ncbi:ABC transporter ATP-binding protein [Planosporangium mesophilum]|uniref:Sugar ABC transporter ATP-binding protein n=1 Tax=Planosporangium mesophilum TaxID=689768 RepID=A0A8J3X202_9ACTN|nr:ABC transporter ATP-binding protein [Planosporangium mesophilum]NJC82615.1 ABC transporter ATP-binding protein [Planosporangium mesophilum]GII24982.1 sugar ABC transporter ATP-binding protein [Planosporangium mesophilum]
MTTVALKDVTKVFPDGTVAVDNVSLDVASGEFMVLLGPSGCGKSTVLRMIAGLEDVTSGAILLNGESANDLPPRERGVAMVFQDFALYPHMNVSDNIGFPLRLSHVEPTSRSEQVRQVAAALGIGDVLDRKPSQLSGGQRQRVAMGRAIVRRPGLFLMDEPLSNLDSGLRAELRAEISGLVRELGVTCVYVTHDQAEALTMADRVAIMRQGVLQDVGTPTQVYGRPATLYVAAFLGSPRMNLLEAEVYVNLDRHVALHLGDQVLYLPWNDVRARHVAHFHGERIVVGIRAEALVPVPGGTAGDVIRGRVRYLEHHGHESLAFLDIGATAVVVDEMAGQVPSGSAVPNGLRRLVSRLTGRGGAHSGGGTTTMTDPRGVEGPEFRVFGDSGRHHRRPAELAVRLAPYPALNNGAPLTVRVRMEALHFFDDRGRRIDVGWR